MPFIEIAYDAPHDFGAACLGQLPDQMNLVRAKGLAETAADLLLDRVRERDGRRAIAAMTRHCEDCDALTFDGVPDPDRGHFGDAVELQHGFLDFGRP